MAIKKTDEVRKKKANANPKPTKAVKKARINATKEKKSEPEKSKGLKVSEKKWGKGVMASGFCILPSLLLKAQRRLGINGTQLAILIHLADYWWQADNMPHPGKKTIADRMGMKPRQMQRHTTQLEKMGLIAKNPRFQPHNGQTSNEYHLEGLVQKLTEIERNYRDVEKKVVDERKKVLKPGLKERK